MKKITLLFICIIFGAYYAIGQVENYSFKNFNKKNSGRLSQMMTGKFYSNQNRVRSDDAMLKLDSIVTDEKEKTTYVYNENGLLKTESIYDWHNGQWVLTTKLTNEYNMNGVLSGSHLDITSPRFDLSLKTYVEYTYDEEGKVVETHSYQCLFNEFLLLAKDTLIYENDLLVADTCYILTQDNQWTFYSLETNSYDDNNRLKTNKYFEYGTDSWVQDFGTAYEYENGLLTATIHTWYEGENAETIKYMRTYNENNILTSRILYYTESGAGEEPVWSPEERSDYIYDFEMEVSSLIVPDNYEYEYKLDKIEHFSADGEGGWDMEVESMYYYSGHIPTGISENTIRDFKIYPNPASNHVTITTSENYKTITFELYSIDGKKLIERQINSYESVSMEALSSGLYIYNITADGKRQTGKIIKQ